MSFIEFVSHESFPEDEYTKEAVVLCLEGKYRVGYVRRLLQNGSLFWSTASTSAKKNGKKVFISGFEADSNFLNKDIMKFLNERSWETKSIFEPKSMKEIQNDEMPF